jgi:transcriptional regulator with XRE-family HTH domain
MKRSSYGEHDYAFGQMMLTLRTNIGLTQAGLAELLHVSRRAVAEWEAGSSYPKAERLKELIALGVQQQTFAAGREEEEIRALWHAAHQKLLLDEPWLHELLSQQAPSLVDVAVEQTRGADRVSVPQAWGEPRVDWGEALDVPTFYGREEELALLSRWVGEQPWGGSTPLSGGECAGHGRHRQVGSRGHRDAPGGDAVRGSHLAVPA